MRRRPRLASDLSSLPFPSPSYPAPRPKKNSQVHGKYVYASSDTTVWRWRYDGGQRTDSSSTREVIVKNMNADGRGGAPRGHTTRTLAFDDRGRLYVSVGSYANVDADSHRSRIRRFDFPGSGTGTGTGTAPLSPGGFDFAAGEVFADGLRNEVGIAFDAHGVLWWGKGWL